jgi:hypothetical protein
MHTVRLPCIDTLSMPHPAKAVGHTLLYADRSGASCPQRQAETPQSRSSGFRAPRRAARLVRWSPIARKGTSTTVPGPCAAPVAWLDCTPLPRLHQGRVPSALGSVPLGAAVGGPMGVILRMTAGAVWRLVLARRQSATWARCAAKPAGYLLGPGSGNLSGR